MKYIDRNDNEQTPVMIHRAIFGSLERFVGTLIEHYAGDFPVWLAPVQVAVIPISSDVSEYVDKVVQKLIDLEIVYQVLPEKGTLGAKIRQAELEKIPYMLIIGRKEAENNTVSVRRRKKGDLGSMPLDEAMKLIEEEAAIPIV